MFSLFLLRSVIGRNAQSPGDESDDLLKYILAAQSMPCEKFKLRVVPPQETLDRKHSIPPPTIPDGEEMTVVPCRADEAP